MDEDKVSEPTREYMEIGSVLDALGISGDYLSGFDHLDFLIATQTILESSGIVGAAQKELVEALDKDHYRMRQAAMRPVSIATFQAGTVAGLLTMHPASSLEHGEHLIDRMLQAVRTSRLIHGEGSESYFRGGFTRAHTLLRPYGIKESAPYLDRYCNKATVRSYKIARQLVKDDRSSELSRPSAWSHILNGLAAIAMIDGYKIQPPDHQRNNDGSWDLPHES